MADASLAVEVRTETGKGVARKLRAEGRIPAVLYGHGKQALSLTFHGKVLERLLKNSDAGVNTLIDLEGSSDVAGRTVLVKDLQRHPVVGTLQHADFFEIDTSEKIQVDVPIRLTGTSEGVKLGGILDQTIREIELLCLPTAIPDSIDVDITHLQIGDALHVSDLTLPEGVESSLDEQLAVAAVSAPRVDEVIAAEEAAAEEAAAVAAGEAADAAADDEGDKDKDKDE